MRAITLYGGLALFGMGCLNIVAPLSSLGGPGADAGRVDAHPDAGTPRDGGTAPDAGDAGDDGGTSCLPDSGVLNTCVALPHPSFGTATPQTDLITSWGFAVGDLNNDGIADLVKVGWSTGSIGSGEVFVYYAQSDGGWSAGPTFSTFGTFVAVGDLDGDGWADIVHDTTIELNQHDGSFSVLSLSDTQGIGYSVLIADLDGDGRPDLTYCTNAGVETFFDQSGRFDFKAVPMLVESDPCEGVTIGDFDQDGIPDLAETQLVYLGPPTNETVLIRFGLGQGQFSEASQFPLSQPGFDIQTADLDGDGWPDLIVADTNEVAMLKNEGCGVFRLEFDARPVVATSNILQRLLVGDLNGDCYPEILAWGSSVCNQQPSGDVELFPNAGSWVQDGVSVETNMLQPWGAALWRPAGATLPSLVFGEFCSGNFGVLPNQSP